MQNIGECIGKFSIVGNKRSDTSDAPPIVNEANRGFKGNPPSNVVAHYFCDGVDISRPPLFGRLFIGECTFVQKPMRQGISAQRDPGFYTGIGKCSSVPFKQF